jgi:hypothetical protein
MTRALNDEQRTALTAQVPMARLGTRRRHRRGGAVSCVAGRELHHGRDAARQRRHVHGLIGSRANPDRGAFATTNPRKNKQKQALTI